MLVDLEQIATLYQSISSQAIQQKTPILILVAPDVSDVNGLVRIQDNALHAGR